ncbi:hypothetical protein Golax_016524 [Gossypium laxum]|uniref:Uncharacterized protein n=1 Tax=Gossypium laxum TaxID=34288 RepID=A0A7J8YYQ1_9ROSI|nr:hypothetical protein [Gossypium laxum]
MVISGDGSSRSETTMWGWLLVGIGSLVLLGFLFTAFISHLLPPSNYTLIAAIQNDSWLKRSSDDICEANEGFSKNLGAKQESRRHRWRHGWDLILGKWKKALCESGTIGEKVRLRERKKRHGCLSKI